MHFTYSESLIIVLFLPCALQALPSSLCATGASYCEDTPHYPVLAILQAIRNQQQLVNTPGLWDSETEVKDVVVDVLQVNQDNHIEIDLYENGIVPY